MGQMSDEADVSEHAETVRRIYVTDARYASMSPCVEDYDYIRIRIADAAGEPGRVSASWMDDGWADIEFESLSGNMDGPFICAGRSGATMWDAVEALCDALYARRAAVDL